MLEKQSVFTIYKNDTFKDYFDYHIYFFKYEGIIREVILNYKFKDKSYLYKTFSDFFIKNEFFCRFFENYDIIMPVPLSKKRNKERGYNQSYLIATELSEKLNLELINNCLYKTKNVIEQSKLSKEKREENVHGVYSIKNIELLKDKKILLIDDIYTTGSTVNECCKVLHIAKPSEITVLTIAKD